MWFSHSSFLKIRTFSNLLCHSSPLVSIVHWIELHTRFIFPSFKFPLWSSPTTAVPSGISSKFGFSSRSTLSLLLYKYLSPVKNFPQRMACDRNKTPFQITLSFPEEDCGAWHDATWEWWRQSTWFEITTDTITFCMQWGILELSQ